MRHEKGRGRRKPPPVRDKATKPARTGRTKRLGFFGSLLAAAAAAASSYPLAPPVLDPSVLDSAENDYVPQGAGFGVDGSARLEPIERMHDGRSILMLGGRAAIPTCLPCEEARGTHGAELRPDRKKGRFYLLNLVNGAGLENGVWRGFLKGSKPAEKVIHGLWRSAVVAKRFEGTAFVPLIHHEKTISSEGERAYKLAEVACDASESSVVEAGLIYRKKGLKKTSAMKREDRPELHKNSVEINVEVLEKIVDAGQKVVLVDDGVCTGSTLEAVREAIRTAAKKLRKPVDVEEIVVVRYVGAVTSLKQRCVTTASELHPRVAKVLAEASAVELNNDDGTDTKAAAHAGIVYAFAYDGYVYVGSHIVPEKTWARLRKKFEKALRKNNFDEVQAIANELGDARAKKHQKDALARKHNRKVNAWVARKKMPKNFDITKIFATQAVVVSKKNETRRAFYFDGLLPLEQAALDQLRRLENEGRAPCHRTRAGATVVRELAKSTRRTAARPASDAGTEVKALNVNWVASGSAMHLQELHPDPRDGGKMKRKVEFIEVKEKRAATNALPETKKRRLDSARETYNQKALEQLEKQAVSRETKDRWRSPAPIIQEKPVVYVCDGPGCGFKGTSFAEVAAHEATCVCMRCDGRTGTEPASTTAARSHRRDHTVRPCEAIDASHATTRPRDSIDTTTRPRKRIKENGRGDQITRETPLKKGMWRSLREETVAKFASHGIKTVGQLAALGVDRREWKKHLVEENFAKMLFGRENVTESVNRATAWKNKAIEALKQK